MPVLSKFYGIVIRMLFLRNFGAHFHAIYGNSELVVSISPVRIVQGDAPARVRSMVLEWALEHQGELLQSWQHLANSKAPVSIKPLV